MAMQTRLVCLGMLLLASTGECHRTNTVQHALAMSNKTKTDAAIGCKTFKFTMPEGTTMEISRSKSAGQIAAKVAKGIAVAALLTGAITASYYSAGLFDSFIAVNEAVPVHKLVYSGGRVVGMDYLGLYYKKSAIQAFGQTLTFLAGGAGASGSVLVTAAAKRIGLNMGDLTKKEEHNDVKWLEQFSNQCELAYFDVTAAEGVAVEHSANAYSKADRTDGLAQLEEDTNKQAQEALVKWCAFYKKNRLFGGEHQPVPEVCKIVFPLLPKTKRCDTEAVEIKEDTLTCSSIISLSGEEQAFQMAVMQMGIMSKMQDKAARAKHCENKADVHLTAADEQMLCNGGKTINKDDICPGETKEQVAQGLHEVENLKSEAMYDCLAVQSCELLRKDANKLQGKQGLFNFKSQKHNDMLDMLVKRCAGHSKLFGHDAAFGCTAGKNCPEDTPEMFLPLVSPEAAQAAAERTSPCDPEEPAETDIRSGKCECIEGATFSASEKKCQCIPPPQNSNKVSFMEVLPQKTCKEKCEDGLVEVKEGDATRCISNFVFKVVTSHGKDLKQNECEEGKLELKQGICITKEMVDGILAETDKS